MVSDNELLVFCDLANLNIKKLRYEEEENTEFDFDYKEKSVFYLMKEGGDILIEETEKGTNAPLIVNGFETYKNSGKSSDHEFAFLDEWEIVEIVDLYDMLEKRFFSTDKTDKFPTRAEVASDEKLVADLKITKDIIERGLELFDISQKREGESDEQYTRRVLTDGGFEFSKDFITDDLVEMISALKTAKDKSKKTYKSIREMKEFKPGYDDLLLYLLDAAIIHTDITTIPVITQEGNKFNTGIKLSYEYSLSELDYHYILLKESGTDNYVMVIGGDFSPEERDYIKYLEKGILHSDFIITEEEVQNIKKNHSPTLLTIAGVGNAGIASTTINYISSDNKNLKYKSFFVEPPNFSLVHGVTQLGHKKYTIELIGKYIGDTTIAKVQTIFQILLYRALRVTYRFMQQGTIQEILNKQAFLAASHAMRIGNSTNIVLKSKQSAINLYKIFVSVYVRYSIVRHTLRVAIPVFIKAFIHGLLITIKILSYVALIIIAIALFLGTILFIEKFRYNYFIKEIKELKILTNIEKYKSLLEWNRVEYWGVVQNKKTFLYKGIQLSRNAILQIKYDEAYSTNLAIVDFNNKLPYEHKTIVDSLKKIYPTEYEFINQTHHLLIYDDSTQQSNKGPFKQNVLVVPKDFNYSYRMFDRPLNEKETFGSLQESIRARSHIGLALEMHLRFLAKIQDNFLNSCQSFKYIENLSKEGLNNRTVGELPNEFYQYKSNSFSKFICNAKNSGDIRILFPEDEDFFKGNLEKKEEYLTSFLLSSIFYG